MLGKLICWLIGHPKIVTYFEAWHREPDGSVTTSRGVSCPRCYKDLP